MSIESLRRKALSLGATEFGVSPRKTNKYYVVYAGKKIHFGHSNYQDFTQHKDPERRKRYLARASNIKDKSGNLTAQNKNTANYWSIHVGWD